MFFVCFRGLGMKVNSFLSFLFVVLNYDKLCFNTLFFLLCLLLLLLLLLLKSNELFFFLFSCFFYVLLWLPLLFEKLITPVSFSLPIHCILLLTYFLFFEGISIIYWEMFFKLFEKFDIYSSILYIWVDFVLMWLFNFEEVFGVFLNWIFSTWWWWSS